MARITTGMQPIIVAALGFWGACENDETRPRPPELVEVTPPPARDAGLRAVCEGDCSCESECCPEAPECYQESGVGDECMAQRDNSVGETNRLQFRLTWSLSVEPAGNNEDNVYTVLASGSELPWSACGMSSNPPAGFIQLLDLNLEGDFANHTARTGYATHVPAEDLAATRQLGLCMVDDVFNSEYALGPEHMSGTEGWPAGLRPPMEQPWDVAPVIAKRRDVDFDISDPAKREEILGELGEDPDHQGVFYLEDATGFSHGYSPLAFVVLYVGGTPVSIPIREAQTFYQLNDATERSCIGAYRGDALELYQCGSPGKVDPPWGCANESCPPGEAPGRVEGYFLISEIEQVFTALGATLCISYPTQPVAEADGFPGPRCSDSPKWDPPNGGLPTGDWCAATNSAGDSDCHDAFHTVVYQTYQAFPIRDGTCRLDGTEN